ncbi:ERCC4 domain-containing protein [Bacillus benzoevorans]|uniref:ERCC4 domain-containing protein n=1 Tax=Bacillus benzoevorans TaxID=1456 RepID=UPI00161274B3
MDALALYQFTEKELKGLLNTLTILIDTREQNYSHIIEFFNSRKIPYMNKKLDVGDYAVMIPKNEGMGILRDLHIPVVIERKAHIDELIGNFKADKRTAFQNELIRSKGMDFVLIIEQGSGYSDILANNYKSEMKPQSVIGTLKTFESRYDFNTIFIDRQIVPIWIYHHLYYRVRNVLKGD